LPWESKNGISWNGMGMAVFAASKGSDEGFTLFDKWSKKSEKEYNAANTAEKWGKYHSCPPTEIGVGSIFHWADEAAPGWRALIGTPFEQATKIAMLIPLSTFDYEAKRKAVAKELGMRVTALGKIVEPMRSAWATGGLLGPLQSADADG